MFSAMFKRRPIRLDLIAQWTRRLVLRAAPLGMLAGLMPFGAHAAALNDTGLTQCVVWDGSRYVFVSTCAGTGQDAEFGRDARRPGPADGWAGFSWQKVDADGSVLPRDASEWSCVRDAVTGLTWEVKTADGGVRDKSHRFTNLGNGLAGDASAYVTAVNASGLCGASDWRLPSRVELESLLDFDPSAAGQMIDTPWFIHSATGPHWSSTSAAVVGGAGSYRWAVDFAGGQSFWYGGEYGQFALRLVRGRTATGNGRWAPAGDQVTDRVTQLVWRRCAEGQTWGGQRCTGTSKDFLTRADAVAWAQAQAAASGQAWRLPNIKELSTIADARHAYPAVDPAVFPGLDCYACYSSTAWSIGPVYSWRLNATTDGTVELEFWGGAVLLVRDAK